jgi:hypothetical protein
MSQPKPLCDVMDTLYRSMLNDPNVKPEVKVWLADYMDGKHKPVELKPETQKPLLEYYPDGELVRYLSDGAKAPKRNQVASVGSAVDSFADKYKL